MADLQGSGGSQQFLWVRERGWPAIANERIWLGKTPARQGQGAARAGTRASRNQRQPWSQAPQCKGLAGNQQDASFRNTVDPARVRFPVPKNHSHPMIRIFNAAVMLPHRRPFHLHASPKAQPARPALPAKTTMPAGSVRDAVPSPPVVLPLWTSAGPAQRQLMSSRHHCHRLHAADCVGRRRRLSRPRLRLPPPAIPPHGTFTCHTTLDECSVLVLSTTTAAPCPNPAVSNIGPLVLALLPSLAQATENPSRSPRLSPDPPTASVVWCGFRRVTADARASPRHRASGRLARTRSLRHPRSELPSPRCHVPPHLCSLSSVCRLCTRLLLGGCPLPIWVSPDHEDGHVPEPCLAPPWRRLLEPPFPRETPCSWRAPHARFCGPLSGRAIIDNPAVVPPRSSRTR